MRTTWAVLLVTIASVLSGCGNPQSGGGTELPLQVYVIPADGSAPAARVQGKEWRLWSVEDSAGYAQFVSRGVLADSNGIITLPFDPGMYLVEGWKSQRPNSDLPVTLTAARSAALDTSCLTNLTSGATTVGLRACTQVDSSLAPSWKIGATTSKPELVTLVRLPERGSRFLDIRRSDNNARETIAEARLWEVVNGDSLQFAGRLRIEPDSGLRIPVLSGKHKYVLEFAGKAGMLPNRIPSRQPPPEQYAKAIDCWETIVPPLNERLTVHSCPDLTLRPSQTDSVHPGATGSAYFSITTPAIP
jgi:hypothetical protein